jgi:hypothetical protein
MESDSSNLLSHYDTKVSDIANELRSIVLANIPGVNEKVDLSAKMITYAYGPKYKDLICVIIPSKKEVKLGFNRGTTLHDPEMLLEGNGKISRYVVIRNKELIYSDSIKNLLLSALILYRELEK